MQDDLCHPYILSTTVLSDKYVATYVHMLFIRIYLSPTMYVHVCVQVLDHITAGMEDILGHVGHNKIRVRSFNLYDVASFFSCFMQTVTVHRYYSYRTCKILTCALKSQISNIMHMKNGYIFSVYI